MTDQTNDNQASVDLGLSEGFLKANGVISPGNGGGSSGGAPGTDDPGGGGNNSAPAAGAAQPSAEPVNWSELFGAEYKTIDDVRKADFAGKVKQMEELQKEVDTLKTKQPEKPVFSNSPAAMYDAFIQKTNIDDFSIFQKVSAMQMPEKPTIDNLLDIMVMERILKNPDYKGFEAQETERLRKEYGLIEGENTDAEMSYNSIRLKEAAAQAFSRVKEVVDAVKASTPDSIKAVEQAALTANSESWKPIVTKLFDEGFRKFPIAIPTKDKDGKDSIATLMEIDIPDDVRQRYMNELLPLLSREAPSEKTLKEAYSWMQSKYVNENFSKIMTEVFTRGKNITSEEYDRLIHNPEIPGSQDGGGSNGGQKITDPAKMNPADSARAVFALPQTRP